MALVFWSSPGVRNPQAMDWYGPWSLKNQVEWQEVSSGWVSKTSPLFTAAPHHPQMGPSCHRKTSSGLLVILHDGELYNYFIIYHNTVIIRIKCTMNAMRLNHPETICPPGSTDKLSFTKLVPGAKKVGDCWSSLSLDWFSSEKRSCHFFGSYISSAAGLVSFRTFYVWLEWVLWKSCGGPRFPFSIVFPWLHTWQAPYSRSVLTVMWACLRQPGE